MGLGDAAALAFQARWFFGVHLSGVGLKSWGARCGGQSLTPQGEAGSRQPPSPPLTVGRCARSGV